MVIYEDMSIDAVDGPCGKVVAVVVNPPPLRVTHLVIARGPLSSTHLVPIVALDAAGDRATLSWTRSEVLDADLVRETDFVELAWPYYASEHNTTGREDWPDHRGWRDDGPDDTSGTRTALDYDRIPTGSAEIRGRSQVISSDSHVVGHVEGFVISRDFAITHMVLEHGHLFRHRNVTIPVSAIARTKTDVLYLTLTSEEVARDAHIVNTWRP